MMAAVNGAETVVVVLVVAALRSAVLLLVVLTLLFETVMLPARVVKPPVERAAWRESSRVTGPMVSGASSPTVIRRLRALSPLLLVGCCGRSRLVARVAAGAGVFALPSLQDLLMCIYEIIKIMATITNVFRTFISVVSDTLYI